MLNMLARFSTCRAEHDPVDQQLSPDLVLFVNHPFGQNAVGPETGRNQKQQAGPEQETALPFQAGLAQSAFYGLVGHDFRILRQFSLFCQRKKRLYLRVPLALPVPSKERLT